MQLNLDDADTSIMGGIQPADFVLEKTDCDAFVAMFDKDGKGWLNAEDLGKAFNA